MTSPTVELQTAIIMRLQADPKLAPLIGDRVYDHVPLTNGKTSAKFPYVSFGPVDEISDDATCVTGFEITMQLDVWSRAIGFQECRKIIDLVRRSLLDDDLEINDNALVSFSHRQSMTMRDPDGLTSHGVMSFVAYVEQT